MSFDLRILRDPVTGLVVDLTDAPEADLGDRLDRALDAMARLEAGAIANADEGRQVGHYWLRAPERAPDGARREIEATTARAFALDPGAHTDVLVVGIGGSALGPQLVADCLSGASDRARLHFLDNTDPDGMRRVLDGLDPRSTLVLVVSKSGRTPETRNGMLAARARWAEAGEPFAPHAIAITGEGSELDTLAAGRADDPPWRDRFPLWDWVGGRTSVTGPVGLVPMVLCGYDTRAFLDGARGVDALTRLPVAENPAARLAAAWYAAGGGRGDRALVIEPYCDRLLLLGRYLQQLVMESLGKRVDRQGRVVHQGLAVYGNKGSTDQHAFVQQVRDGRDDAFVHFVDVREARADVPVGEGQFASDHLLGLLLGTRRALAEAGRPTVTLSVPAADARSLGALIALFERAVGIYAELVDVNAYHQPGVEAGKRAAADALAALPRLAGALGPAPETAERIAARSGLDPRTAWRLLTHLASTGRATLHSGSAPAEDAFSLPSSRI